MAVRPIDAMELKQRMCALCNQAHSDEPCEPNDCVFVRAINEAPTLTPQNEWVSVDERLPAPTENPVLVYDCTGVNMAWYSYAMGWTHRTGLPGVEITHWMPLPEPPEKE